MYVEELKFAHAVESFPAELILLVCATSESWRLPLNVDVCEVTVVPSREEIKDEERKRRKKSL